MRKIGLAVLVGSAIISIVPLVSMAQTAVTGTPGTTAAVRGINNTCVQGSVDTREAAIGAAFSALSTAEGTALSTRASALHDAWGMTDAHARRAARSKAWTDFRTANREAFKGFRTGRTAAWDAFRTASKACGVSVVEAPNEEAAGSLGL